MSLAAVAAVALVAWALVSSSDAVQAPDTNAELASDVEFEITLQDLNLDSLDLYTPVGKGGGKGGKTACCDPAAEPGTGGNPFCFEGHTCCSDGQWRCNNADATPSCNPGEVCVDCTPNGGPCDSDDDCCSGRCKGGKCR